MKKALFLILLLPFIGFTQTTLVRWTGQNASTSATTFNTNVSSTSFTSAGITVANDGWNGIRTYNWSTQTTGPDNNKYIQFTLTAASGYQVALGNFNYTYVADGQGANKITIKYSFAADFASPVTLVNGETPVFSNNNGVWNGSPNDKSVSFNGAVLQAGKTVYVRVYGYAHQNTGWMEAAYRFNCTDNNGQANSGTYGSGPAITGTVSNAGGVIAANDTGYTVAETQSVNINVLNNDTATNTTFGAVTIQTPPSAGTATVQQDKSITFTAPTVTSATSYQFTYKVTGADNSSATATVTVAVSPFASPTVTNYTKTTGQNIAVSTNVVEGATAGSGTISGVSIVGNATNGTATVNGNNVVFTPASGFTGTGSVTYKVTNSNGKSTNGTINITVEAIVAASAANDTYTVVKNVATELNVMSNDNIGNGGFGSIIVVIQPAHGVATVTNTNKITYTPTTGYTGTDSFTYKITSNYNSNATATVSLTVVPPSPTGALAGTLTVGTGGDFATITAAVNHLNANGLSSNVTFSLINNAATKVYNVANGEVFPITINGGYQNGSIYTVTFKPAAGKNIKIEAPRPYVASGSGNGDSWAVPAVFKLYGADNIIFDGSNAVNGTTRNMLIVNSSYAGNINHTTDSNGLNNSNDYTDRAVIWLAPNGNDAVNNITIKYAQIKQAYKNSADNYCMGIFGGSSYVIDSNEVSHDSASAAITNVSIINNDMVNVKEAIFINGNATSGYEAQTINIADNDLGSETNTESVILPVSLNNVNGFNVYQNYIYKLYRNTTAANLPVGGINITGTSRNGNIYKNDIKDLKRITEDDQIFAGIVLASTYPNSNIKVYNNFVLDVSAKGNGGDYSNGYGIVVDKGSGYKIYHNTVVLTPASNQSNGGYSAALYVNENVTGLDVRNNIFVNTQTQATTRRTAISVKNTSANINTVFTNLDYNNYFSTDRFGFIGANGTVNITWPGEPGNENPNYIWTLDGWKSAVNSINNGKEAHSKNTNPTFVSATDLHINAYSAQNNGFADSGTNAIYNIVSRDIDGQIRKTATPDMGADEFGPANMPAAGSNTGIYCSSSTTFTGYVSGVAQWSNGLPASDKDVIFNASFTQTGGTLEACSMYVMNGASVNFISQSTAIVQHSVNVDTGSTLTFESDSHLIQVEDDQNTGIAIVKRKSGLLKRLDYTLWYAPVIDYREGSTNGATNYQSLLEFSPLTSTSPSRFYYYNTATDLYAEYSNPAQSKFEKGKAVLIRMPNAIPGDVNFNNGTERRPFEGIFEGTPNTGTVRIPLQYASTGNTGFNAIGNPYPSPININAFIQENVNNGSITGTLWLWRKTNNSAETSYATVTLAGYTANAQGNNTGNTVISDPTVIGTGGMLNTGQGFILRATAAGKEVVFKNNMRDNIHNATFFRTLNNDDNTSPQTVTNGRVWINAKNAAQDTFTQVLVAYNEATTTGYDAGYDGTSMLGGNLNLYSLLPAEGATMKLAIQARGNFVEADVVPLGYSASAAGTYEFEIDHVDGIFAQGQDVYIKDNMLGTTQKLNSGNYVFTSDAGTFDSRFQVVYVPQGELGTEIPVIDTKDVIVYRDAQQIKMTSPEDIESVTVYDMLGRTLFTQNNISGTEFSTPALSIAQQVVIINITLDNKQVVSKKIMMN